MRLGIKIFALIFLIALTIAGASSLYFYYQAQEAMLETVQSQLLTAAKSFSGLIPGDKMQDLTTPEDMVSTPYIQIQNILYHITQTNEDFLFAYTMRLRDNQVYFVVDSPPSDDTGDGEITEEEMPEPIGSRYPDPPETLLQGFVRPSVDTEIHKDQWGWTISGYAPVQDYRGRNVGLLGIDMCAEHMENKLGALKQAGIVSLSLAGLLALGFTIVLTRRITNPIQSLRHSFQRIQSGDLDARVPVQGRDELAELSEGFNQMAGELKEKQLLQSSLGKVLNKELASRLLSDELKLGGDMSSASILFCDLRGFSGISQKMPPKFLVNLLNEYFSSMVQVVEKHGGMVDKFVGDKIMAVFGHPEADPRATFNAMQAGLEMLKVCDELNQELDLQSDLVLENSIGVHTGRVLAGNIGSPERMEYTVIGDAVNIAAKLEDKTRELGTRLLLSSHAVQEIGSLSENLEYQGEVSLQGRTEKMEVYALLGS